MPTFFLITNHIFFNHKYFSSFQKLYQCENKFQTKIQITQQHNKSKLKKKYLHNKRNNCQRQNIIVSLQKKIVRRINIQTLFKVPITNIYTVSVSLLSTLNNVRPRHLFKI